jgi:hypothetical protein
MLETELLDMIAAEAMITNDLLSILTLVSISDRVGTPAFNEFVESYRATIKEKDDLRQLYLRRRKVK